MHKTVLLTETIDNLNIKEDGVYVDATLGFGGHSGLILKRIKRGFLFAFDKDDMAIEYSKPKLSELGSNFEIIKSDFSKIKDELLKRGITSIDGIVFDLGVSSPQLDIPERGFSFHKCSRLDMRMDRSQSLSAYEVVNEYSFDDLYRIIRDYGEEKYAKNIAKNIVKERENKKIETTFDLVDIIKKSMPYSAMKDSHPGRRTFQALRIEVNNELDSLKIALEDAINLLKVGGRISVITFHSLEDRIVKELFRKYSEVPRDLKKLPFLPEKYEPKYKIITNITPSLEELEENSRAHSARLRVIERIKE